MEEFDFLHHLCIINSNSTEKIIIFSAFFYPKSGKNERRNYEKEGIINVVGSSYGLLTGGMRNKGNKENRQV